MTMRTIRFKQGTRAAAVAAMVLVTAVGAAVRAQSDRLDAELRRIFQTHEYAAKTFGPAVWIDGGSSYIVVETTDKTSALVSYETATGRRDVLVDASMLTPPGAPAPLRCNDYEWSQDGARLCLHEHAEGVAREHARRLLGPEPRRAAHCDNSAATPRSRR